jgi:SAM-dependent methyltransferase
MSARETLDLGFVARLYEDSLAEHGTSSKGVGWPDEASHRLRHAKLATVIDDEVRGARYTVNDLGCGYGAFYEFLLAEGRPPAVFHGYDVSARMVEQARRRIAVPQAEFREGTAVDVVSDYSVASGIFNVRQGVEDAAWIAHVLATLDNLHVFSTKGFAFNLLTSYVEWRKDHLFYGDPLFFFDHCRRRYSRRVALLHDYPLWEWTIIVKKEER